MSNGDHRLYLYENQVELVVTTDAIYVDNRPMNNKKLVAHKGLNNEIIFNIRNRDRKLQNVFSDSLVAYLVNPYTRKRLLTKRLENTSEVGIVKLTLAKGDLQNIGSGLHKVYITRTTQENEDLPLFSSQNNDVNFDIEITDEAFVEPVPTQETTVITQMANTALGASANIFVSDAMYGNLDRNFHNAQHSIGMYVSTFTGNLKIQASCLSGVPDTDPSSHDWFDVSNISTTSASNIIHSTFIVNANWVRVLSYPADTDSSLDKVVLRN